MADPEVKKQDNSAVITAINEIAATEAGRIFFRWLLHRCFFDRSTIVGNIQTYEVNTVGSISQEFLRKLYLEIRRYIKPEHRKKIEQ